jgi:glycosyltransferase involved in cell wall biosynthesis
VTNNNPKISVVSPVYGAENLLDELVDRIIKAVSEIESNFEIILVEDHSFDKSWGKIEEICKKHPNVIGVKLSRNFGQQHAIQAGLDCSKGDFVITMDCDLQDKPEEIYKLYNKAKEGYDIVLASREKRKDNFVKRLFSSFFYKILGYLSETEQDSSVANFVLYRRSVVDALDGFKDHRRYYPMLNKSVGFNTIKVKVVHAERPEGKSSYNFKKRIKLAFDTILTFSDKPLRISVKGGATISFSAILLGVFAIYDYINGGVNVQGWTSLAILITFFSGVIISVLGMVGLYVGKTFEAVKMRPTYIVQKTINKE